VLLVRWKTEDVRAFRDRDWAAFERAPVVLGPGQSEALASSLYEQLRAAIPGWPSRADREDDYRHHVRMVALFERIHAERGREDAR
jgi:hypothetical protein